MQSLEKQVKNRFNISDLIKKLLNRVLKLEQGGSSVSSPIPTLQEVTEQGISTTQGIVVIDSLIEFTNNNNSIFAKYYNDHILFKTLSERTLYLSPSDVTVNRVIAFPDATGTLALIEDLPNINSYSTTESVTGGTWVDGKPIYRIVINTGAVEPLTSTMILSRVAGSYTILEYTKI